MGGECCLPNCPNDSCGKDDGWGGYVGKMKNCIGDNNYCVKDSIETRKCENR